MKTVEELIIVKSLRLHIQEFWIVQKPSIRLMKNIICSLSIWKIMEWESMSILFTMKKERGCVAICHYR